MPWNQNARNTYFNLEFDEFLNIFFQQGAIIKINNLDLSTAQKNHLKDLIKLLTEILPMGHFACPSWPQPYAQNQLLLVGGVDAGGSLKNNLRRRIGITYGRPINAIEEKNFHILAFGKNSDKFGLDHGLDHLPNVVDRRVEGWGINWNEHWSDNSVFFTNQELDTLIHQFMIYTNPFQGALDEYLRTFLIDIETQYVTDYGVDENNTNILFNEYSNALIQIPIIPQGINVLTPLILSSIHDEKRRLTEEERRRKKVTPNREQNKMNLNTIFYGPPGTGKTHITISKSVEICGVALPETEKEIFEKYKELQEAGRIVFVTFHQSYGYEEFIQGLRPVVEKNGTGSNSITYEVIPGVFKKLCQKASQDSENNYVIVIDEINRANISKVFGELITLLEESKRSKGTTPFSVKLPNYLKNNESGEINLGEDFSVPSNLYVIGTMNTADRSIALLDTALRRRFHFQELMPDYSNLCENVQGINLETMLRKINSRIEKVYDRDHMIGHAYFLEKTTLEEIQSVFKFQIIPLLTEYFYDDFRKIMYVLNDINQAFIIKTTLDDQNNEFETRSEIYQINNDVASLDAIKRIYEGN